MLMSYFDRPLLISCCFVNADTDLSEVADKAEADARWIIDNTKPCPRCDAPIQKNEGCNQMICRKVSYTNGRPSLA